MICGPPKSTPAANTAPAKKGSLAVLVRRAMDFLPTDVVELILRKLAEQDPRSLLQATCACKSFLEVSPAVWREAYLAPYPVDENALGLQNSEALDDKLLVSLGGYKRLALVKALYRRASKQHFLNLNKHAEKLPTTEIATGFVCTQAPKTVARYLFVYKVRGVTFSGTFSVRACSYLGSPGHVLQRSTPEDAKADGLFVAASLTEAGVQLLDDSYGTMLKDWTNGKFAVLDNRRQTVERLVKEKVSDLEVYVDLDLDVSPKRRECKPWAFYLSMKRKRTLYTFPVCKGKVYLVSQV